MALQHAHCQARLILQDLFFFFPLQASVSNSLTVYSQCTLAREHWNTVSHEHRGLARACKQRSTPRQLAVRAAGLHLHGHDWQRSNLHGHGGPCPCTGIFHHHPALDGCYAVRGCISLVPRALKWPLIAVAACIHAKQHFSR